jgi:hypothetical protein
MDAKLANLIDHVPYVLATRKKGATPIHRKPLGSILMRCIYYSLRFKI